MNESLQAYVNTLILRIEPIDEAWRERANQRLNTLTKPLGSLGRLEAIAAQVVAIRRELLPAPLSKSVTVFAADHGVTAERVSAYPSTVTQQMVLNFLSGGAAVNVLAGLHGVALTVVDVGVAADFFATPLPAAHPLVHRKVTWGTRNLRREAAMSADELQRALETGAAIAQSATEGGHTLLAVGEMGIGNTTAASAITCALTGVSAATVTGRGTGLADEAHAHKIDIVEAAVAHHFRGAVQVPALDILRCVGGLEIAAMTGFILCAASLRQVVVIDGFISTAAAAIAVALSPATAGYLIAGHCSEEPGHRVLLDRLGLAPLLTLSMRLGEGSGAVLAMPLIEAAMALYTGMATFIAAGVSEASA